MSEKLDLSRLFQFLFGKTILILGFGREGQSSLAFLERHQSEIQWGKLGIADQSAIQVDSALALDLYSGPDYLSAMAQYDIVLKSPGISFKQYSRSVEYEAVLSEFPNTLISSQIDLVLRFVDGLKIGGISGTKGKSTCTSLLYSMMDASQYPAYLRGNIGVPVLDDLETMPRDAALCLELSSHQLEFIQASPYVSALTNFYPEHLDHYRDYDAYLSAKLNILRFQKHTDYFVLNADDEDLVRRAKPLIKGKYAVLTTKNALLDAYHNDPDCVFLVHINEAGFSLLDRDRERGFTVNLKELNPQLKGLHHYFDAALAAASAYFMGADEAAVRQGIANFKGLAHRNQWVRNLGGVDYFNDSIATIPQSTLLALETLENVSCLIVGGMDRGLDYSDFCAQLLAYPDLKVICLPDTGAQVYDYFGKNNANNRAFKAETVKEAVSLAQTLAIPGTSVLLSPAASSYHRFKNFEDRGNSFIAAVEALEL